MSESGQLSLRQRDQIILISSLVAVALLSWVYLFQLDKNMQDGVMNAGIQPWKIIDFFMMFLMWAIMMVAMMLPSAMRSVLIFARLASKDETHQQIFTPILVFVLAYITIWTLFSIIATTVQWLLEIIALLSPMMVLTSAKLGSGLLIITGLYQLTPLKDACLKHCQSPLMLFASRYQKGHRAAFQLGFSHGLYCLGCCWMLMCLLFVGGVMNLLWILAISLFVLAEKLLPPRIESTRLTSFLMISAGLTYLWTT